MMNWEKVKTLELTVYSTPWCGDCRRLKRILASQSIAHQEIDIDANPQAAVELKKATGRAAIPYLKLPNEAFVRGWHDESPAGFDERIFFAEIAAALS